MTYKKIVVIANMRPVSERAHSLQTVKSFVALAELGMEVEIIYPQRHNPLFKNTDVYTYYHINKHEHFSTTTVWSLDLIRLCKKRVIQFWLALLQAGSFFMSCCFYLFKHYRHRSDVAYFSRHSFWFLYMWFSKKTKIYEAHNFPETQLGIWIHKHIIKSVDKIIVISEGLKRKYLEHGIDVKKISVLPDGVDLSCTQNSVSKNVKDIQNTIQKIGAAKIIGYTGGLYAWKGVDTLVQSAQFLNNGLHLLIVGGKEGSKSWHRLKSIVTLYKLKNVHMIAFQPPSDVQGIMNLCDIMVLPTSSKTKIGSEYTSPLKLFEYMANKKAIVASDVPSSHEVLNKTNSVFFKADNPKSLADALNNLSADTQKIKTLGHTAYQDVLQYSWQARAKKFISLLN